MYEAYYHLAEKPFSLTPDPKYLYRSESHENAFELLQYAIERREGFVVVTGDIGTGKTTLCRALLDQIDRTALTALVLNPFLSEEDLLKRILVDFGVISRADLKSGRLTVTKQELIDALYDFLLGLIPLNASAVLIIDEAQNLPLSVLEQIRILSNLETDKEKLLQIILVGQLNLQTLLRSPELRQLDQRVSIRYELKPLDREGVAAYVAHRLAVAGGSGTVSFSMKALEQVHRFSRGIPRLINLICDRALVAGFSERAARITHDMVERAAESLDIAVERASQWQTWFERARSSLFAGTAVVLIASACAVGASTYFYEHFAERRQGRATASPRRAEAMPPRFERRLPRDAALTIFIGAFPASRDSGGDLHTVTEWLEASGLPVYYADVDSEARGRWKRVFAGIYADVSAAQADVDRLKRAAPSIDARVVAGDLVSANAPGSVGDAAPPIRRAGLEP